VVDARQSISEQVVVSEDALVAHLLGVAEEIGVELLDDVDAVNVVDAHLAYFEAIGAVGPQAPLDDVI
jgi:division protein CdvB (Snf7/Vps24/ESCRT-III family)